MEAESQAVLNTAREHDFQQAFQNGRCAGSGAYARKGTTAMVMVMVAIDPMSVWTRWLHQSRKLWMVLYVPLFSEANPEGN
jgi:hypothetical protein